MAKTNKLYKLIFQEFAEVYAVIPTLIGYTRKHSNISTKFRPKSAPVPNIECGSFNQDSTTITALTSGIFWRRSSRHVGSQSVLLALLTYWIIKWMRSITGLIFACLDIDIAIIGVNCHRIKLAGQRCGSINCRANTVIPCTPCNINYKIIYAVRYDRSNSGL